MRKRINWGAVTAMCGVLAVAGCTQETTPTTPTTPISTATSEFFGSTLDVGGFAWRQVTVKRIGTVTVRLASLDHDVEAVVAVTIGTFNSIAKTCEPLETVETKPDLTNPQLTRALVAGEYCVRISDIGNLTRANKFTIVIALP